MRKTTLTILLVAAVAATWAQKPDKKTVKLEKQLVGSFVEVPAGHYSITIGKDTTWVTLAGFRMLETEVTNASYNLFLEDLKAQGRMADYEKAKIDTTRAILVNRYGTHPAFPPCPPYPVSCISHEGAMLFCCWLTEKMGSNEWVLLIMQIGQMLNCVFDKIYLLQNTLNLQVSEMLPTYVYKVGMESHKYGLATAGGLLNSVMSVILVLIANTISKKVSETSLF